MDNQKTLGRIYKSHIRLVRNINDTLIFVGQSTPILRSERLSESVTSPDVDLIFKLPGSKTARRNPKELREIFDRHINRDLLESLLVSSVSKTEAFIFDTLSNIISAYPKKLSQGVAGLNGLKSIPLDYILESDSIETSIHRAIEAQITSASYATPAAYLKYLQEITGVDTSSEEFKLYLEIKAARDLIVHNGGIVNSIYIDKAGDKSRCKIGKTLPINEEYFGASLTTLKRVSGSVWRDINTKFGPLGKSK